ncbi:ribose-phosphate diphosphokinase [Rhodosalinus sp. K401]|uniref:ribose-phosphate diphosphokinase n=1 Tax=Rhodosalinus sp. K401 TaxID=3239195 RepID=UPI0035242303
MRFFALDTEKSLAQAVADAGGFAIDPHEIRDFEEGEHKGRPLVDVQGEDVFVLAGLRGSGALSTNDRLIRTLFFIGACRDHGAASVTAICPLLPYARKDRRTKPHDPLGARYVAQLLEAVGTSAVVTVEAHNPAAFDNAFRIPALHLDARQLFMRHVRARAGDAPFALVSPDIGGFKRVQLLAESFDEAERARLSLGLCEKRRSGGVVSGGFFAGDVRDRPVWILDDMIVGGGTMRRAIRASLEAGASEVRLAATHALFDAETLDGLIAEGAREVVVTDTAAPLDDGLRKTAGLEVLAIAPVIAACVARLRGGTAADLCHAD